MTKLVFALGILAVVGCDAAAFEAEPVSLQTDFAQGDDGWVALFTNYPAGEESFYEIDSGNRPVPPPLAGFGFLLTAMNHSDDINMHVTRQVVGLVPGARYRASFRVTFATNVPSGCLGVGGSPGEGVTVHAAASTERPRVGADGYGLSLASDYQPVGEFDSWYRAFGLGDIANGRSCDASPLDESFMLKTLTSAADHASLTADEAGQAWLLVGTRSGYEATSTLYYTRIEVGLRPE
ncbi:hypothetical protein [Rubrivirga sp.]|uniref:hypothetical protein n=1 Tax=Rubrivirga sp. TaxID=1885344 RepID=UPI003C78E806